MPTCLVAGQCTGTVDLPNIDTARIQRPRMLRSFADASLSGGRSAAGSYNNNSWSEMHVQISGVCCISFASECEDLLPDTSVHTLPGNFTISGCSQMDRPSSAAYQVRQLQQVLMETSSGAEWAGKPEGSVYAH